MARKSAQPQPLPVPTHHWLRSSVVCLLTVLGILTLFAFMVAHWAERQILTTDNWVAMVGPLPQDPQVASAISTYSVDQLFEARNVEGRIKDALPEKAAFLAAPLSSQLQTRVTNLTTKVIQSDKFNTIWVAANKTASQRLINNARGITPPERNKRFNFNLDLGALRSTVSSLVNNSDESSVASAPLASDNGNKADKVGLAVDLKSSLDQVKFYIRMTDIINATFGLLAVVCLLGAIVISLRRRRLVLVIGISIMVISLLQLIGMKTVRPAILNIIENSNYRPAVGAVYDVLLANFRRAATVGVMTGAIIALLALVMRSSLFSRSKYLRKQLTAYKRTSFYARWLQVRQTVRQYRWQAALVVVLIGLALMAFVLDTNWQGVARSILWILLTVELINLVAARQPVKEAPMN